MKTQSVIVMAAFLFLILFPSSGSAVQCSDVLKYLRPCVQYLKNGSGMPPSDCCAGATSLSNAATSSDDKKTVCNCIKNAAQKINPQAQLAQSLAQNCGITLPVPVSPNVDCTKIG
ncbi:hypothetical protein MLD38_009312 [Melastoma candidum]|uniref:Uncharacterized protein n=1 Tax=Melastoma candidum TaxID=119954 RepID=A0ACB9S1H7_9MYRT|nr:hypothetical protein MLD38_009312 [Melastoma candidum]